MAVTYAKATESTYKAGANVSSTATGASLLEAFGLNAEGKINVATEFNWSSWYTTYGATYPEISELLVDTATNLVAIYIINYDMSGFTNIQEATSRINVLYTLYIEDLNLLKAQITKDFLNRFGA